MKNLKALLLLVSLIALSSLNESVSGQNSINTDPQNGSAAAASKVNGANSEGTMARVNLRRNGVYNTKGVHQLNKVLWTTTVLCSPSERNVYSTPIIAYGMAYYMCSSTYSRYNGAGWDFFSNYYVYAIDISTGYRAWVFMIKQSALSNFAVAGGMVYVGSSGRDYGRGDGDFFALDAETGAVKWRHSVKGRQLSTSSPAVSKGVVYFTDPEGSLYALDATTGTQRWVFNTTGSLTSPAIFKDTIYFMSSKGYAYAVDANTGQQRWEYKVGAMVEGPVIANETVYILGADRILYGLDANTGSQSLKIKLPHGMGTAFSIEENVIYYGGEGGNLYAVDVSKGRDKWIFKTGKPCGNPVLADGTVYSSCFDSKLYAINAQTGHEEWKLDAKQYQTFTPALADGAMFFARSDGILFAIR
jgi:eukaryotic-like serine/threonine-protein kinase